MADKLFSDIADELLEYARKNNDVELALVAVGTASPENYLANLVSNAKVSDDLPYSRFVPAIKANAIRRKKVNTWLNREQRLGEKANRAVISAYTQEIAVIDSFSRAVLLEIVRGVPAVDENQTQLDLGTDTSKKPKSTTRK